MILSQEWKNFVEKNKNAIGNYILSPVNANIDMQNIVSGDNLPISSKERYAHINQAVDIVIENMTDAQKDAVADAVKADISFMSLAELMHFASRFPFSIRKLSIKRAAPTITPYTLTGM